MASSDGEDDELPERSDDSGDSQSAAGGAKKPSLVQKVNAAYEQVVNVIIRPPRTSYNPEIHLGPVRFEFCGSAFKREDFTVISGDEALVCSRWSRAERVADMVPALIFLHGNASARLEALPQLNVCLSLGLDVVAFDFSGSGLSDGEYVTLGARERFDIAAVVSYLRAEGKTSTIALWGRSMGAVAALLYADADNMVDAMILDSPFASLRMLAEELVARATATSAFKIPGFAVGGVMRLLRSTIRKRADADIDDVAPIKHVAGMYVPALFCVVRGDSFISNKHSELLHKSYAGDKFILAVDGDHNDARPPSMLVFVRRFLQRYLMIPTNWGLSPAECPESVFSTNQMPWHPPHGRRLPSNAALAASKASKSKSSKGGKAPKKKEPCVIEPRRLADDVDVAVGMDRDKVRDVQNDIATLFDPLSLNTSSSSADKSKNSGDSSSSSSSSSSRVV